MHNATLNGFADFRNPELSHVQDGYDIGGDENLICTNIASFLIINDNKTSVLTKDGKEFLFYNTLLTAIIIMI